MVKLLVMAALLSGCGKYAPEIKAEGDTESTVTTTHTIEGEVVVTIHHIIDEAVCDEVAEKSKKDECLLAVADLTKLLNPTDDE